MRGFDAFAAAQLFGLPAVFVLLVLGFFWSDLPATPLLVQVLIGAAAAAAGVALVLWPWSRAGGYASYRALRRWVRNGPEPMSVPPRIRIRFLRGQADQGSQVGWMYVVVAVIWLSISLAESLGSVHAAVAHLPLAAFWAVTGTSRFVFMRRWAGRAQALYNDALLDAAAEGRRP